MKSQHDGLCLRKNINILGRVGGCLCVVIISRKKGLCMLSGLRCSPTFTMSDECQSLQAVGSFCLLPNPFPRNSFVLSYHKPGRFGTNHLPTINTGVTFEVWWEWIPWEVALLACGQGVAGEDGKKWLVGGGKICPYQVGALNPMLWKRVTAQAVTLIQWTKTKAFELSHWCS